ncbi:MAG TPA: type II secretion system protein [Longimicrobium sp.]|nr:type II secretion system protein [Longimicrobium sp.]
MSSVDVRDTRGFTLVEVLVALMLTVLLGGILFQIVRGQARFTTVQSARQEVQQNARGAMEIVGSELRAVQDSGLIEATANSITFLLPRAWGVSCRPTGGTTMEVIFPTVPDTTVMFAMNGASGLLADTSAVAGTPGWGPLPAANGFGGRATVTSVAAQNPRLGAAGNVCAAIRPDSAPARVQGLLVNGSNLPAVPAGNSVYIYQVARYDVSLVRNEYWIRRSNGLPGDANQQALAGPLTSAAGLAFTYHRADGTEIVPGTDLALLRQVARIAIKVATRSRSQGRANQSDSLVTSVLLRN